MLDYILNIMYNNYIYTKVSENISAELKEVIDDKILSSQPIAKSSFEINNSTIKLTPQINRWESFHRE